MWIWLGYILGQFLHIALRAQNMLRSPKNECNTIGDLARRYGLEIIARVGIAGVGLSLWSHGSQGFSALLISVGLPALPLTGGTAFAFGLGADLFLDSVGERYPILRRMFEGNGVKNGKV